MEESNLAQNFAHIVKHYQDNGFGATEIAKMIGYTSTSQLNNSLENKSMLSTKAILTMIERLNLNPIYLFLGKGDMFLNDSEETDYTKLYNEYNSLNKNYQEALKIIAKLSQEKIEIEKLCTKMLGNTAELVKYYQTKAENTEELENEIEK